MTTFLAKAGLALAVAATAAIAPLASASAFDDVRVQVQYREDHRWGGPNRGRDRDRCAPWLAEEKASRMGLRRARVIDVNRRVVVVGGFDRGGRDRIVFANVRGCPVVRR
ncbi:hypothetical protein ACFSE1_16385 [Rhizobium helianthi]|uniref:Antifreeze protein n=1 Tax=Rhizobium helianthi TaxID=1132695 RepID=A0ABW4M6K5_9HYPH